jgi:ribosomal protein RSM22 (predicted rRNA methylase)
MDLAYPELFEKWWTERAEKKGLVLSELRRRIQFIRDIFTFERRRNFYNYSKSEEHWLAYGFYWFPQNFVKTKIVLSEALNKGAFNKKSEIRFLDLGSGSGAGLFSAVSFFAERGNKISAVAVEKSKTAIKILKEMYSELKSSLKFDLNVIEGDMRNTEFLKKVISKDMTWDLVLIDYSLGEAFYGVEEEEFIEWFFKVAELLRVGGTLIIIEPALKETSERLERVRDIIAKRDGFYIVAPCPHRYPCPLLKEARFWCHEVRTWVLPNSLRQIDRRFSYTLNDLRFSFLVLMKGEEKQHSVHPRLISPVAKLKGKFIFRLCGTDGKIHTVEVLKRNADERVKDILSTLKRGDEVGGRLELLLSSGKDTTH